MALVTYHQKHGALGSDVTLTLVSSMSPAQIEPVFTRLWLWLFQFEKRCSRFLPASELSQFNANAGVKRPVSPEFKDILSAALQMAQMTGGLYNPFILPALQKVGYVKSLVPTHAEDAVTDYSNRTVVPPKELEIGDNWARIPYGTALDLGGCGKGYAGDTMAITLIGTDIQGYWLSVGGDVAAGGLDADGNPWCVQVTDPLGEEIMGEVQLPDAAPAGIATSSIAVRQGKGMSWHHLIDPKTLKPAATDTIAATIYASSLIEADVLASSAIIEGSSRAENYAEQFVSVKGGLLQLQDTSNMINFGEGVVIKRAKT